MRLLSLVHKFHSEIIHKDIRRKKDIVVVKGRIEQVQNIYIDVVVKGRIEQVQNM